MDTHHVVGPSEEGSVVLDIGGDVGAAIVHAPVVLDGSEIEIRRHGAPWDGTHVAVRPRLVPGGQIYAALFPALGQGSYEVRRRSDTEGPVATLAVEGGRVAQVRLGAVPCGADALEANPCPRSCSSAIVSSTSTPT
jgi:hypothetical protein